MAKIRSLASISEKWARVTPGRAAEYQKGVENPKADWAEMALKAKDTWKQAITAAAARDAYSKGVSEAGTAKWKKGATQKGPGRFAEGVQIAQPEFQKGWSKYHSVIEKVELPPRYPKGEPRNLERVKAVATALRMAKVG